MPDSSDYRLYINECFKGMHTEMRAEFKNVHDSLDFIKAQTFKTNNRVTHLEDQRDEYLKTRVSRDELVDCQKKLETISDELIEYKFLKKYPKIFIGLVVVLVIGMLVGFGMIRIGQEKIEKAGVEVVTHE